MCNIKQRRTCNRTT